MNRIRKNLLVAFIVLSHMTVHSAQANTSAKNRNDVYNLLSKLNSELALKRLEIWINEKTEIPSVNLGQPVYFTIKSATPAFYTLIHVDSKGTTTLINPASTVTKSTGSNYIVYPPLLGGCKEYKPDDRCFNKSFQLVQSGPIGQDAVFILASTKQIPYEVLGMNASDDVKSLGKDISAITKLVEQINSHAKNNPISVVKYVYAVESIETQYSTRAISKQVTEVATGINESLVFNNIKYSFDSSELTVPGRVELDGLGSALVGMQEQSGEFPLVELTGHTDSAGPAAYNESLSIERAESAKAYLMEEHGIPDHAILTDGKGENEPMVTNGTKAGRAANRRVVLKIPDVI